MDSILDSNMEQATKVIGITGGIGSGKSFISNEIERRGYAVYNSDLNARNIIDTDPHVIQQLKQLFGNDIYSNNCLNRPEVAKLVFANKQLLQQMNAIVHPAVKQHFITWAASQKQPVFLEAAILVESGFHTLCDELVLVTAPLDLRIKRVLKRDNTTQEAVAQRIKNQMSDEALRQYVTVVINNDETKPVSVLVDELFRKLEMLK